MRQTSLSKPMQAGLSLTVALSALALLKPPEARVSSEAYSLGIARIGETTRASDAKGVAHGTAPWVRVPVEEWGPALSVEMPVPGAPPLPLPEPDPVVPPPMAPPAPVAPDPGLTYLGRMEQSGRRYVFLGRGPDSLVTAIGERIDGEWRVERMTPGYIELRYLPLNEVRRLPVP